MDGEIQTGACLCRAVTFEIGLPSKWCAHCHCTLCRREHGAAFVTWVGVHADRFRVVTGGAQLVDYASTPEAVRSFCGRCGSSLFFRSTRWPDEVHVVLSNLDGPIDRAPQSHVSWDTHVPWVELGDGLPRKPTV